MNKIIVDESTDGERFFDADAMNYEKFFRQQVQNAIADTRPGLLTVEAGRRIDAACVFLLNKSNAKLKNTVVNIKKRHD